MRNYTETDTFREEFTQLQRAGIAPDVLREYKSIMEQFDENGMECGTDYSLVHLAFPHPLP